MRLRHYHESARWRDDSDGDKPQSVFECAASGARAEESSCAMLFVIRYARRQHYFPYGAAGWRRRVQNWIVRCRYYAYILTATGAHAATP